MLMSQVLSSPSKITFQRTNLKTTNAAKSLDFRTRLIAPKQSEESTLSLCCTVSEELINLYQNAQNDMYNFTDTVGVNLEIAEDTVESDFGNHIETVREDLVLSIETCME